MDPAILQQAVGRAHRMGQTKTVHVYRVLMSGTIEVGQSLCLLRHSTLGPAVVMLF